MRIYIGGDVSKGYADFCITDAYGHVLKEVVLDDSAIGHQEMSAFLREQAGTGKVSFIAGVEATGGLELNWLHLFKGLETDLEIATYQVNPFVLKRFTDRQLHANKTDAHSARAIAEYLRLGLRPEQVRYQALPESGLRTLERHVRGTIRQLARLKTELQALLQRAHPELVQYCRGSISQWLLRLIATYPTPRQLAGASAEDVASIPYVTKAKAERLIAAAEQSVASQQDEETALALQLMAEDILRLQQRTERLKERLWQRLMHREGAQILSSIEGIGTWSATVLYCEIGDVTRFPSASQLVAFAGLDPRRDYSGDQKIDRSISKRGNRRIRNVLYNCVRAGLRERKNQPLGALYDRLRERGKPHMVAMVACMRKLLAIVYGCWSKGERFDPNFERRLKERKEENGTSSRSTAAYSRPDDLTAPVSSKEAKRRREATRPQKSNGSCVRSPSASPSET